MESMAPPSQGAEKGRRGRGKDASPRPATPQTFMEAAAELERDRGEVRDRNAKLAWRLVGVFGGVALVSFVGAVIAVSSQKPADPLVLMVNQETGGIEVAHPLTDGKMNTSEAVDKGYITEYVRDRLMYDWVTISTDAAKVKLMSTDDVAKAYEAEVKAADSPLVTLKEKGKVTASVGVVTFIGNTAQARVVTQRMSPTGENIDGAPPERWLVTLAYKYDLAAKMTAQQRAENPLGFKVVSWRKDAEVSK